MTDLQLDIIGYLLAEPLITVCESTMAPMRRPWLFRGLRLALVFAMVFKFYYPPEIAAVGGVFPYIILPMFFFKGSIPFRAIASFLGFSVVFISEFIGIGVWYAITGDPIYDFDAARANFPAFLVMHAAYALVCIPCFFLMRNLLKRIGKTAGAGQKSGSLTLYVLVPLVQAVFLLLLGWLQSTATNFATELYVVSAIAGVLSIVVDIVLIVMADRSLSMEQSIREASEHISKAKDAHEQAQGEAERLARIRHDLKNQLGAAKTLAEEGKADEAGNILEELKAKL